MASYCQITRIPCLNRATRSPSGKHSWTLARHTRPRTEKYMVVTDIPVASVSTYSNGLARTRDTNSSKEGNVSGGANRQGTENGPMIEAMKSAPILRSHEEMLLQQKFLFLPNPW